MTPIADTHRRTGRVTTSLILAGILAVILGVLVSIGHAQTDIFFDGGLFFNEVIFTQDFTKGSGPFHQSVMINNTGDTVRIFLRNGGSAPAQGVSSGSVTLNGQVLFNTNDFKIEDGALFAVVTKKIQLLNGQNTLDVELKGGGIGTINLRILRASSFPAGTVFVAPEGVDSSSCGTLPSTPCKTIGQGLSQAFTLSGPQVVVANGVYVENVTLVNGIDVLGGFSSAFSTRNVSGTGTVILGSGSSPSVVANSITAATRFEGFIVHGPTVTTAGGNSVAVSIVNSTSALEIRTNVIVGGVAGDGTSGFNGFPGATGNNGTTGGNSQNGATTIAGGFGGTGGGGIGGAGGMSTPPVFNVSNGSGVNGQTLLGGIGGAGGDTGQLANAIGGGCIYVLPGSSVDALPGAPGGPGNNGIGGTGGLAGTGLSGTWVSTNGGAGAAGAPGGGGGGGGAGGGGASTGSTACVPNQVTGPSGGGGGAGGAGGSAGGSGQGGGGAFNIFVFNRGPTISSNQLFLGTAGNGGSGGQGGKGGGASQGGPAGSCLVFGCGAAGAGGAGGSGGHAGGSGGGAGGPSVGIYSNFAGGFDTTNIINTTTGVAGFGGGGGQSLGNNGLAGTSGSVSAILVE